MSAMVRKILLPTDLSASAFDGIRYVATQLASQPVECTLLHIVEHSPVTGPVQFHGEDAGGSDPVEIALWKLRSMINGFTLPSTMQVEPAVRFGEPWKEILRYAGQMGADLIVVTAGSAASEPDSFPVRATDLISRYSPVPVLMLRPGLAAEPAATWEEIREQMHIQFDTSER